MEIKIKDLNKEDGFSNHQIAIVTTKRGLCYYLLCAEPFMTRSEVADAWKNERSEFLPYSGQWGY